MRYTRAVAFSGLRQALEFRGLLTGEDPWCEAIRQHMGMLQGHPLTRSGLWTVTKLVEAVLGLALGLNLHQNEARRKIEANTRGEGRRSA